MLEDCIQHVEEAEAGLSTSGMEETKERIWAEEETKKKSDRESKASAKGTGENQRLDAEREIWSFWKDLDKKEGKVQEGYKLKREEEDDSCREFENSDMKTKHSLEDVESDVMTEHEDALQVDRVEVLPEFVYF